MIKITIERLNENPDDELDEFDIQLRNEIILEELKERYRPVLEQGKGFFLSAKRSNMPSSKFEMKKNILMQKVRDGLKEKGFPKDVINGLIQYEMEFWSNLESEFGWPNSNTNS